MIGMANVTKNYPLYAEAANEKGVCIAGLNFPGNACYQDFKHGKINIASYELIPWLLGKSKSADEAAQMLREVNITGDAFTEQMSPAPLHWMLADQASCYVVEAVEEGVKIYPNPIGVLTNNPPFPFHLDYIRNFFAFVTGNARKSVCKEAGKRRLSGKMGAYSLWRGNGSHRASRRCFAGFPVREGFFPEVELRVRRRCRGGNLSVFFISWTVSVWCGDPYRRRRENMRPLFIPVVSGPGKGYTIIRHMMIRRSAEWICFRRI